MNFEIAILVFGLMLLFLWDKKADVFLIVFGISVYLFLLMFKFFSDPIGTYQTVSIFLLSNPLLAFILLFSPLGIYLIYKAFMKSKIKHSKGKSC